MNLYCINCIKITDNLDKITKLIGHVNAVMNVVTENVKTLTKKI